MDLAYENIMLIEYEIEEIELQGDQQSWITKLLDYFNTKRLPRNLGTPQRHRLKLNALNYNMIEGIIYRKIMMACTKMYKTS